jgi:hypothetical protein
MATASHKFSREAAFVLATEALQEATIAEYDVALAPTPSFGSVEDAIESFRRDPSEVARARLERATSEFRASQRATALARWRGHNSHGSTH